MVGLFCTLVTNKTVFWIFILASQLIAGQVQQHLNLHADVQASDVGESLYKQATLVLDPLPDLLVSENVGNFYRPRKVPWVTLLLTVRDMTSKAIEWAFPSFNVNTVIQKERRKVKVPVADADYKRRVQTAVALLEESAAHNHPDALYTLAEMNFYGNYTHRQDFPKSLQYYHTLSRLTGNSTAQFMVGLMHSTGMFGTIPINQAKASLYYTFAANSGDMRAQMAMGYRHLSGIGTSVNPKEAIKYYKSTADKSFEYFFSSDAPGGRYLEWPSWILPNDDGGVYGKGASYASSGFNAKKEYPAGVNSVEDAVNYFKYLAEENSVVYAHFVLAMLYFEGGKTLEPDFEMAVEYAKKGAEFLWQDDWSPSPLKATLDDFSLSQGGHCAGFIGTRYLNGQGVIQDVAMAKKWFELGIEQNDYISLNSLGFMYYHGIGVEKDVNKAVEYFKRSVDMKYGPAYFNLGYAYFQRNHPGDMDKAYECFEIAGKKRNFASWYYKALMLQNIFPDSDKLIAVSAHFFKLVSETVQELHSPLKWAHDQFASENYGSAMLGFLIAAEEGYESAQVNLAYILDEQRGLLDMAQVSQKVKSLFGKDTSKTLPERNIPREKTALVYWTRAALQKNYDAMVKVGDYYINGIGTGKPDVNKAASCYYAAGESQNSLALWNLGWMHENGIGAEQSYHLAKRYYDMAAATSAEAFLPVQLALLKLRFRSFWSTLLGRGSLSNEFSDEEEEYRSAEDANPTSSKTFREGLVQLWRYWRDTWPEQDHQERQRAAAGFHAADDDVDPVELPGNTFWDDGDDQDTFGEDIEYRLDSLEIIIVCAVLGFIWYRQTRRRLQERELQRGVLQQQQQQQQQQAAGNNAGGEQVAQQAEGEDDDMALIHRHNGWVGVEFRAGL